MNITNYTALFSAFTAACALVLTSYGLYATRRHHKLSVRPHLDGCSNKDMTDAGFVLSYDLSNNGIGPAKIKKFTLLVDKKPFPMPDNGDYIEKFVRENLKTGYIYEIRKSYNFGDHPSVIKSGATYRLVEIIFPGTKSTDKEEILKSFNPLGLCVEYESFYEERFTFNPSK